MGQPKTTRLVRRAAFVFLVLIFCLVFGFAGTAFAQSRSLEDTATRLGDVLRDAQTRTVVVADFVGAGDGVTLQGVLLADRLFALLEPQNPFRTLDSSRLRRGLYSGQLLTGSAFEKAEMEAAHAAGAEVLIAGRIEQQSKTMSVTITASNVSTKQRIEQWTLSIPRTRSLDQLATQSIQSSGPIYVLNQNGVSTPTCVYCPYPQYSEAARKKQLQGDVVVMTIIGPTGRAEKIWEVRGISDGLTEEAIKIVRHWRFKPADLNGNPVSVMVPIDVSFRLL
jgi:TonB family protein